MAGEESNNAPLSCAALHFHRIAGVNHGAYIRRMWGRITKSMSCGSRSSWGLMIPVLKATWMPRYNGAPGHEHWDIRQNPKTGA
jgi:hypothetical protein